MKPIEEHMAFYEAYHRHPLNKATHFIGIPLIVFSLLVLLSAQKRKQRRPVRPQSVRLSVERKPSKKMIDNATGSNSCGA